MQAGVMPGATSVASKPKPLFTVAASPTGFGPQYSVDRAGETFYVNSQASGTPNAVTVVLNWRPWRIGRRPTQPGPALRVGFL